MLSRLRTNAFMTCSLVTIGLVLGGCTTVPGKEERARAGMQTGIRNMQEDINRINGRQDQLEVTVEDLRRDILATGAGDAGGKASIEQRLTAMENRIKFIDEAREADKREIIEKLSQRVADVINKDRGVSSGPAGGGVRVSTGEGAAGEARHVVKEKETLSGIAQKYGVTVEALVTANRLKSANVVRVGQTLVIPR
ncbi:MAG: LysM domain-containing protein [bacterium]